MIPKIDKKMVQPISKENTALFMTDVLTGVLKDDYNEKDMYAERIEKRVSPEQLLKR
ncbi:MAG: hypothetical protein J1F28_02640 [Oscillospiraceae bacterium]|nr:hypothetical protein [Oscillospiraceae bacterium]